MRHAVQSVLFHSVSIRRPIVVCSHTHDDSCCLTRFDINALSLCHFHGECNKPGGGANTLYNGGMLKPGETSSSVEPSWSIEPNGHLMVRKTKEPGGSGQQRNLFPRRKQTRPRRYDLTNQLQTNQEGYQIETQQVRTEFDEKTDSGARYIPSSLIISIIMIHSPAVPAQASERHL